MVDATMWMYTIKDYVCTLPDPWTMNIHKKIKRKATKEKKTKIWCRMLCIHRCGSICSFENWIYNKVLFYFHRCSLVYSLLSEGKHRQTMFFNSVKFNVFLFFFFGIFFFSYSERPLNVSHVLKQRWNDRFLVHWKVKKICVPFSLQNQFLNRKEKKPMKRNVNYFLRFDLYSIRYIESITQCQCYHLKRISFPSFLFCSIVGVLSDFDSPFLLLFHSLDFFIFGTANKQTKPNTIWIEKVVVVYWESDVGTYTHNSSSAYLLNIFFFFSFLFSFIHCTSLKTSLYPAVAKRINDITKYLDFKFSILLLPMRMKRKKRLKMKRKYFSWMEKVPKID